MDPARKNLLLILGVAALTVFSCLPILDHRAEQDYENLFQRALVTFALARTLNGVISAVQGTELALQPAGVGVTLTPGEVLDPVNDLVERFSWVMLGATISLGVQNVLLDVSQWWGMRLLVAVLGIGWLVYRLRRSAPHSATDMLLMRAFLVVLFLRFAVPMTLIVNDAMYQLFLEARFEESTLVIESAGEDLRALGQAASEDAGEGDEAGLLETLFGGKDDLSWRERFDRMQTRASDVIEHLIELSVVFILQTGVLPIVFLWLFLQVFKRLFRSRAALTN